jgi:hypothetical protein
VATIYCIDTSALIAACYEPPPGRNSVPHRAYLDRRNGRIVFHGSFRLCSLEHLLPFVRRKLSRRPAKDLVDRRRQAESGREGFVDHVDSGDGLQEIIVRDADFIVAERGHELPKGSSYRFVVNLKTGETKETTYADFGIIENVGLCALEGDV